MITKKTYETMKKKYGKVSSWAIWAPERDTPKSNVGNLSVFNKQDIQDHLNPNYVFVGLNVSGNGELWDVPDWANFHSDYRTHHDYKLRYALQGTPYWGSYMTDIIKRHSCTDSSKVMTYLRQNPEVLEKNIEEFLEEIGMLGTSPILVAMGGKVHTILSEKLGNQFTIIPIKHYSFTISKENYRKELLEALKGD